MGLPQLCTADNCMRSERKKNRIFQQQKVAQTTGSTDVEHECD